MLILQVARKHVISGIRGEYIDFVISRVAFVLFAAATALVFERSMGASLTGMFTHAAGGTGYFRYALAGSILYAASLMIFLIVSRSLMTEWRGGTLEYVVIAPHARWQYYTGALLGQLSMLMVDVAVWMSLGSAMGVRWVLDPGMLLTGIAGLTLALLGTSVLTSLLMAMTGDTFIIQNTITPIMLLLGGYLFPPAALPAPLALLASLLPFARPVQAIRAGLFAGLAVPPEPPLLLLDLLASLCLVILGFALLPRIERKALESLHS